MKKPWISAGQYFMPGIAYIKGRREGSIKSLDTGITTLNKACANGLEFGTTTVITARPGTGKTALKDQIIRNAVKLNNFEFRVLDVPLELSKEVGGARYLASEVKLNYNALLSTNTPVELKVYNEALGIAKKLAESKQVDYLTKPCGVKEFGRLVKDYMETHSSLENVVKKDVTSTVKKYTPTLIAIDHSLLFIRDGMDEQAHLDILGNIITGLKREFPIAFILLHQMGRDIEHISRSAMGSFHNYPKTTDLRGSDVILHHADVVLALDKPSMRGISIYGPQNYEIASEVVVGHYLKVRNNSTRISFYKFNGELFTLTPITIAELGDLYSVEND